METVIKKPITNHEKKVFLFLNELRESGITNMFGAAPFIVDVFDIDKNEARKLLSLWMKNFKKDGNYDFISR